MKWPWSKPKKKRGAWLVRCGTCGYEGILEIKPTKCPKCGLEAAEQ